MSVFPIFLCRGPGLPHSPVLLSVLILQRQHDDLPVDQIRVDNDVIALRNAIEEQDDKTLTELLTKRSKPHIAAIITKYAAAHGSLRKHIKQRWYVYVSRYRFIAST